jgi:anti-sigma regulatory factor (Ser/Thr protein kinase)
MFLEIERFILMIFPCVFVSTLASLLLWGENLRKILPRLLVFTMLSSLIQTAVYLVCNDSLCFLFVSVCGFLIAFLVLGKPIQWLFKIFITSYIFGLASVFLPMFICMILGVPGIVEIDIMWSLVIIISELLLVAICLLIRKVYLSGPDFLYEFKGDVFAKWPVFMAFLLQIVLFTGLVSEIHTLYPDSASPLCGAVLAPLSILMLFSSIYIIAKYLKASRTETIISTQNAIAENIQEMITLLRGQQHDFLNQLQIVSALSQTGKLTALQDYVNKLLKDVLSYNEILKLANPALSALINVKITQANTRGIKVIANINSSFWGSEQHTIEIARILGNLLDNALDAVEKNEVEKTITLDIYEKGPVIIMEVKNPLGKEIIDLEKIYQPGFSTKGGSHCGMGLYNCRLIARKICAELICSLEPQTEISFSLILPKMAEKNKKPVLT